jgi:Tfp pilus assembly protein PilV
LRAQAGFALIEVVVSALIAVTVTGGVIKLVSATGRTGAEERHRSQAYSVAQEDQVRLRATQIADLATATAPRTVSLNGTEYTVTSSANFVNDATGTTECGSKAEADYVRLSSDVTWPSMRPDSQPATIESIISPVSGSLDPTHGNLSITVKNGSVPAAGVSGAGMSGSGPGSFSGSTDANGCVFFGGQPAGNYTVTPSLGSEYVDFNGAPPAPFPATIIAGITTPVEKIYDKAGAVKVDFKVKSPSSSTLLDSVADSVTASATGLTTGAKTFGNPGGLPTPFVEAKPLFPFSYSYNFYAGSCAANKPTGGVGTANVEAPDGGTATASIQLPALYLTVKNSSGTTAEKAALKNAKVMVTDSKCPAAEKRTYLTNSAGGLDDPGLPWSTYKICASATISGKIRRLELSNVVVNKLSPEPAEAITITLSDSVTPVEKACW